MMPWPISHSLQAARSSGSLTALTSAELKAVDVLDSWLQPALSHVALHELAQDGLEVGRHLKSKLPSQLFYGIVECLQRILRADSPRCQAAAVKSGSGQKCRQKKNIPVYHRHRHRHHLWKL